MKMLKAQTPGNFTYNTKKSISSLLDSGIQNTAYVFVGGSLYLDSMSAEVLVNFIARGNDAFIACQYMPSRITRQMMLSDCGEEIEYFDTQATTIQTNFYHPAFQVQEPYSFTYRIQDKDEDNRWYYLNSSVLCDSLTYLVPLGYMEPMMVNFYKIPFGKGNLYVHTNPILFSNYFMTKESSVSYASSVISHVNYNNLIWDEFSKIPLQNFGNDLQRSPLYFIMEQQSLRYAWWILLVSIILYTLFVAKRKQKIIPVLEPRANTSLQFVNMVSSLHYHNQNHSDMARKKMRHFLHHIRTKYNLSTQKIDDVFVKKLSSKSHVSEADIHAIFDNYKVVEKFKDITVSRLADLYKHIDNFYKQGK